MTATPNTDRLAADRSRWVAAGTAGRPFFVARASGARIWDVDGREFIDFVGGVGTANHGHTNPAIVAAIRSQLDDYLHQCFSLSSYEPYVEVCRLLALCHPGDFDKKGLLLNSGAEAVENAVKIARYHTGRQGIICLDNAFHGRTLLTMSLTAKVRPYKLGFGPFAPEVYRAPGPYPYRGVTSADAIAGLHRLFKNQVDPANVAAIIFEPVQGEGGLIPMPKDYPGRVAEIAAEHGILIISDEVQAGMGRTGLPAACAHYGIEPDLCTWGKAKGRRLPISQVLDPEFQKAAQDLGEQLRTRLDGLAADHHSVGEVRGLGAMLAIELVKDSDSKEPDAERAARVIDEAFDRGLILMGAGVYSNCIRVLVPLVATQADIDEGMAILDEALSAVG